jgi:hypothetical protein
MRGAIPPLPHTSSCRGAYLSPGKIFALIYRVSLFYEGYSRRFKYMAEACQFHDNVHAKLFTEQWVLSFVVGEARKLTKANENRNGSTK